MNARLDHNAIKLLYGREGLTVPVPPHVEPTVVRKPVMPVLTNPEEHVRDALQNAVDCPSLKQLAASAQSACIAICDITRPVPNQLFLQPVIRTLMESGIDAGRITVLVATGLHRPNVGAELKELVGDPWVLEHVSVVNHYARNDADHVHLGYTPNRRTPIRLDRRFVEADIRIATGLVEPHFMAGYSGGRKVVAPGLAHAETITTFHNWKFMSDVDARNCNLEGNPLHEEQLAIIESLGDVYAINTVIDEDRRLSLVNFGAIDRSHQLAVQFVEQYCLVKLPHAFDVVLTSAAGYPLDKTYYQTIKGMVGAMDILAPGGDLIIAAECEEGLGSVEFAEAQARMIELGPNAFLDSIKHQPQAAIDQWQTQMQLKPQSIGQVFLYAEGLSDQDHGLTGVERVHDIGATLQRRLQRFSSPRLAIIPEGPYVVPTLG